jgi:hypothetical protein
MTKLLAAAALLALSAPAFARRPSTSCRTTTKRCTVVKERPTTTTMVIVGDTGKVYTTEAEAQAAIRTIQGLRNREVVEEHRRKERPRRNWGLFAWSSLARRF